MKLPCRKSTKPLVSCLVLSVNKGAIFSSKQKVNGSIIFSSETCNTFSAQCDLVSESEKVFFTKNNSLCYLSLTVLRITLRLVYEKNSIRVYARKTPKL